MITTYQAAVSDVLPVWPEGLLPLSKELNPSPGWAFGKTWFVEHIAPGPAKHQVYAEDERSSIIISLTLSFHGKDEHPKGHVHHSRRHGPSPAQGEDQGPSSLGKLSAGRIRCKEIASETLGSAACHI